MKPSDDEIHEEIESHLRLSTEDRIRRGESPDRARYSARRELGNPQIIKEDTRAVWSWAALEAAMKDIQYAFRQMASHRGFTAVAVLTIALGIGPTTAIFSLLYAVFWAPSYHTADSRMVVIWMRHPEIQGRGPEGRIHARYREFTEWQRNVTTFDHIGANRWGQMTLNDETGRPERMQVQPYSPGRLTAWGAPFVLGRDFVAEEGTDPGLHSVILTNRFWISRYDQDPDILGEELRLDGVSHRIVGVLAAGYWDRRREVLIPNLVITEQQAEQATGVLTIMGALKEGVSIEQAQAEIDRITSQLFERFPAEYRGDWRAIVEPARNMWLDDRTRSNLTLLMATVCLVLLIACVNVANLLLARGDARLREIAVRSALGASRWQVIRQLLTESLVLSTIGGALGIGFAFALIKAFLALTPPFALPPDVMPQLYPPVLLFCLGVSVLSGLIFGCAPAWQAARQQVSERLKQSTGRSSRGNRLGQVLVISEFALALTLLAGASLVMQRYFDRTYGDFGIVTENILTFDLPVNPRRFSGLEETQRYNTQFVERLQGLPGVVSVAPALGMPFGPSIAGFSFFRTNQGVPERSTEYLNTQARIAGPEFFQTFGVQVLQGRAFDESDRIGSPMAVMVNETFVEQFLSDVDPLREGLSLPNSSSSVPVQIVGVYRDIQNVEELGDPNLPEITLSMAQFFRGPFSSFAVRTTGNPTALTAAIAAVVDEIDPEMPLTNVRTVKEIIHERTAFDRFEAALYGSFGVLSLLLAAVGIYGLMAFVVSRRTAEIGTRMAFGASSAKILGLVVTDGFKLAAAGIVLGTLGAWQITRLIQNQLAGAESDSTAPILTAAAVLTIAALAASYVPARRAAGLDPMNALRED